MNKALYKLTEDYKDLEKLLDYDYDWMKPEDMAETLANVKGEMEDKIENIAKVVLTLRSDAKVVDEEVERLMKRKMACVNRVDWLLSYLLTEMSAVGIEKVKKEVVTVFIKVNQPSVDVIGKDDIPAEYRIIIPESWHPDKKAIASHFKETGEVIAGTNMITDRKHVEIR